MQGEWRRLWESHTPAFAADVMILKKVLHLQGPHSTIKGVGTPESST